MTHAPAYGLRRRAPALAVGALLLAGCGDDAARTAADTTAATTATAVTVGAPDTTLRSPAGPGSAEPNLAVAPDGRVYLSWLEPQGGRTHALRFASVDADLRWTEPRTVVADTSLFVNWADFPSLQPLGDGRLVAHWLERSGGGRGAYDVRLARSADDGRTWSVPVSPHRDGTATEHGFVAMWPGAADSVSLVWLDGRAYAAAGGGHGDGGHGGGTQLRAAAFAADGAVGAERALDVRTCDCCQTSAALTGRGPLVVYRDRSPQEIRDIAAVRLVDGRWTQPAPVHADGWEIAACPVNGPAVAARGDRAVVAWFTAARDTARVQVAFSSDAGGSWAAPARADEGDPLGRVDVELLDDGSALVLWLERTGGKGAAVRLRRVGADGTLGAPVTVAASAAARSSGFPRMARSGVWLWLAWTEPGDESRVRVARLRLEGA